MAALVVILGGVDAALINELPQGWPWWVAASLVVLLAAGLTAWTTLRTPAEGPAAAGAAGDVLGDGAVKVEGDVTGSINTTVIDQSPGWSGW